MPNMVYDIDGRPLLSPLVTRKGLRSGSDTVLKPLTTIDDCIVLAHQLVVQLDQLGKLKYPLDIRKGSAMKQGRREVERVTDAVASKIVKAGGRTYFFDVKRTKEGQPYLVITESRFQGAGKDRERVSLTVFAEHAKEFLKAVEEAATKLG